MRAVPNKERLASGNLSGVESIAEALESLALIASAPARFVTALSELLFRRVRGPLPARLRFASILPGLKLSFWPVICPLNARAIVILFSGRAMARAAFTFVCPSPESVHKTTHTDVHDHTQRHEHKQDRGSAITH